MSATTVEKVTPHPPSSFSSQACPWLVLLVRSLPTLHRVTVAAVAQRRLTSGLMQRYETIVLEGVVKFIIKKFLVYRVHDKVIVVAVDPIRRLRVLVALHRHDEAL